MVSKMTRRETMALLGGAMAAASAPGLVMAQTKEPTLLRISLLPIYSVAPHFAAEKLGYFAEQNITVTTQPIQSGSVGIPGLMSGSFDVLYSNTVSVLAALERGIDLRILCEATRVPAKPPEGLALFRRKDEKIQNGKDLEGKTLAINQKFTLQWLTMSRWIKRTGGDPQKVNMREIPLPSMMDALKTKQVDAAFMLDPYKMQALGDPTLELFAWPSTTVISGLSTGVWVVSGKWADANPELARGYLRAYMKGGKWVNENMGNAEYISLVSAFSKMDPKLIAAMPRVPQEMELSLDAIHGIGDVMMEFDIMKTKVDVKSKIFK